MRASLVVLAAAAVGLGATHHVRQLSAGSDHEHLPGAPTGRAISAAAQQPGGIPASRADADARLAASPRKGAWQIIKAGPSDSVIAWVVQPQNVQRAPVVVVIHENMGLNSWTRAVADQLAADGFIAIAPDLITMKRAPGASLTADWGAAGGPAISSLTDTDVQRFLDAAGRYGMSLPNATQKYGIVGFCWGGGKSFLHAVYAPNLAASVVYYGTPPTADQAAAIKAPVLGLYGGSDARITATVPATDSLMKRLGKTYEFHIYDGAGHGFMGNQEAGGGPNATAARTSWPLTVGWFRKYLG